MKIGVNVSFLRKRGSGIGEVTNNFVLELLTLKVSDEKLKDIEFVFYAEEDLPMALPDGVSKSILMPWYKRDDLIRKIWWEKFLLPRKVREDDCDAFVSLYQCPTILNGVKHVMVVHDLVPRLFPAYLNNWRKKLYQRLSERAIDRADKIISVSEHTAGDLTRELGILSKKITTAHIDCDVLFRDRSFRTQERIADVRQKYNLDEKYIYFGGGLDMRKNAKRLLRAYALLIRNGTANGRQVPQLVISGRLMPGLAPLITDVEKVVQELELMKNVRILGFVPQEDLPALYAGAMLLAYPSLYEGFGLPVLEAMTCGTPVVCSRASSLPEVGGDAVAYCDAKSVKSIASTIEKVFSGDILRSDMIARGLVQSEKFSWDRFVRSVVGEIL